MPKYKNYRLCPHCGFEVHRSTFFNHKALYYIDGKWRKGEGTNKITVDVRQKTDSAGNNAAEKMYCSHCNMKVSERTYYYHMANFKKSKKTATMSNPKSSEYVISEEVIHHNEPQKETEQEELDYSKTIEWSNTKEGRKKQRIFLEAFAGNMEIEQANETKENIHSRLHDMWENVSLSEIKNDICSNPKYLEETNTASKKAIDILHWMVLFVSLWATYFNVSGNALQHLLHFIKAIFTICGHSVPLFAIIATLFPTTLYSLYKLQGTQEDNFVKYVVCPDCCCTYVFDDCVEIKNGQKQSKLCTHVKFPNHPHRTKRKPCGAVLLKEITLKNNDHAFYPRKIYCYNSIKKTLQLFLDRPNFEDNCELWKKRPQVPGTYRDIFDGKVWKRFMTYESDDEPPREFLSLPRHYGLLLNVDWFQPYKNSVYSIGVIYLVIVNLPREERFKQENVILVGLIPGKSEPSASQMSFYLKPLVHELLELWQDGMEYKGCKYYAVLLGCACDLPAGRKLCGLLSFTAKIGCSKCTKEFQTKSFGEKTDYGGFNQWHPKRSYSHLKAEAIRAKNAKTQTEQQAIEKAAGCRWSELMHLPYFDSVQMCIVDPMHNLYLGISKYMLKDIWSEECKITDDVMFKIQQIVDSAELPSDIGRIPNKIATNFSSFTADQHRNWTLFFSLYAMKPYLSKDAYTVWTNFVEACWIFNRPVITVMQVSKAHAKLMSFLKGFETWLDSSKTTPNFHMSSHLAEQILDYGSFYGYWCFPFERYNGIQGNFHTNQRSVELQLMRNFLRGSFLFNLSPPEEYKNELNHLLKFSPKEQGSLSLNVLNFVSVPTLQKLFELSYGSVKPLSVNPELYFNDSLYEVLGAGTLSYVDSVMHKQFLSSAVESFLGPEPVNSVSGGFKKFNAIRYLGESYGSVEGTMKRNSHIIVNSWLGVDSTINCNTQEDRPAEILYFIQMNVPMNSVWRPVVLAYVRWFQKHSAQNFYQSDLAQVYAKSIFEINGPASFVPIQKIKSKFISGFPKLRGECVRVVIPRFPKIYW